MNYQKTVISPDPHAPLEYRTALVWASNSRGQHRPDWSARPRNGGTGALRLIAVAIVAALGAVAVVVFG
jgi:hypothetical protein